MIDSAGNNGTFPWNLRFPNPFHPSLSRSNLELNHLLLSNCSQQRGSPEDMESVRWTSGWSGLVPEIVMTISSVVVFFFGQKRTMLYKSNPWKLEWEATGPLEFTWRFKYLMCDVVLFVSVHAISLRLQHFFSYTCILIYPTCEGRIQKIWIHKTSHLWPTSHSWTTTIWRSKRQLPTLWWKDTPSIQNPTHSTYWRFRLLVLVAVTNINQICIYLNLCVCKYIYICVSCLNNILDMYINIHNIIYMHYCIIHNVTYGNWLTCARVSLL